MISTIKIELGHVLRPSQKSNLSHTLGIQIKGGLNKRGGGIRTVDLYFPTPIKQWYILDLFAALSIKSGMKIVTTLGKQDKYTMDPG